jgi:hypothetical protein
MEEKKFISFYTLPFWIEDKVEDVETDVTKLKKKMKNVIINEENDDFIIKIEYDGLISFHIKHIEKLIQEKKENSFNDIVQYNSYMQYINAFYLLLTKVSGEERIVEITLDGVKTKIIQARSGGHSELKSLSRHDTFRMTSKSSPIAKAEYSYSLLLYDTRIHKHPSLEYNTLYSRSQISISDLKKTIALFKSKFHNHVLINHLALYLKSTGEYKHGDWDTSIVLAWTISENILNIMYDNRENKSFTSKSTLIYHVQIFLNEQNMIDDKLFTLSNKVRKYRNNIAHSNSGYTSSHKDNIDSLECAIQLIKLKYNLDLPVLSSRSNIILSN